MTAADSAERAQHYDPRDVQEKWQARWATMDLFRASGWKGPKAALQAIKDAAKYASKDAG